jgi:hypothetical protein
MPAAAVIVLPAKIVVPGRIVGAGIDADRLEQDVEVARHAEPRAQGRGVELMRAEIVEDRGLIVEQRLDVHELPGPVFLAQDALAERETIRPDRFDMPRTGQILRASGSEHALLIEGRGRVGFVKREQHFTQFDPPIRADHDRLTSSQQTTTLRRRPKPRHIPHHTITDQIRRLTQCR